MRIFTKMSKCNKPTNACKICLGAVTQKNGLKCQGACQTWVHYACLNYTPGRINDIKKGIIKVTCPCPDCKTSQPKEYRTDEPFSCTNTECPANLPPRCENVQCPVHKDDAINQTSALKCPLGKCGTQCKQHSHRQLPNSPPVRLSPPCSLESTQVRVRNNCPTGCKNTSDIPGDLGGSPANLANMDAIAQMCNTVGLLANQINELMMRMKDVTGKENASPPKANIGIERADCPKPCFCPGNPGRKK